MTTRWPPGSTDLSILSLAGAHRGAPDKHTHCCRAAYLGSVMMVMAPMMMVVPVMVMVEAGNYMNGWNKVMMVRAKMMVMAMMVPPMMMVVLHLHQRIFGRNGCG